MKYAILGSGIVGRTIAARLVELGHDAMLGTHDVDALMARTAPDMMGNPPFAVWQAQNTLSLIHISEPTRPY